jgi:hypothetical protein
MGEHIIESGAAMDLKIATLTKVKVDYDYFLIFYLDELSGEKWIREQLHPEMQAGGPPQLRLIDKFPWE